ncbi:type 1 periplasmic binding fold superfamily protein [Flavobacterium solisilvae]|uniref:Type 1 periplasmic binding fold superfamily protein n=1 Tax=Flavobacterium solisilvae TaxID=1852019 RepID=A0ABX1QUS0_9FLAO|nr:type 1 periplasmic binding fold superfamily protein [Flavobacterium solisilvae]NMH25942.1 type 1 periplasmic binding fold superfamily protein [Flavobacterium solisilvae]
MKYFNPTKALFLATASLFLVSCSDDNNGPVNEEEVITTVTTTLTNGATTITLTSRDLDGDGPNDPLVTVSGNLTANTVYNGETTFLNELDTPADNITTEVEEEGEEHQIFYQIPAALGTIGYTDFDVNAKPVGLTFTYTTGNAGTGNLTVTLRHLPNKSAAGVAAGDITNAGGATDAQVTYPIVITN